jgi:hypothetical protein
MPCAAVPLRCDCGVYTCEFQCSRRFVTSLMFRSICWAPDTWTRLVSTGKRSGHLRSLRPQRHCRFKLMCKSLALSRLLLVEEGIPASRHMSMQMYEYECAEDGAV